MRHLHRFPPAISSAVTASKSVRSHPRSCAPKRSSHLPLTQRNMRLARSPQRCAEIIAQLFGVPEVQNTPSRKNPPTNIDVPDQLFNHVHLDIIVMPLTEGFRYYLIIMDRFSRWPHVEPLQDIRAETIAATFYNRWISLFGTPLTITTVQGTQFESALFTALASLIGAGHIRTTPYHPQRWKCSRGGTER